MVKGLVLVHGQVMPPLKPPGVLLHDPPNVMLVVGDDGSHQGRRPCLAVVSNRFRPNGKHRHRGRHRIDRDAWRHLRLKIDGGRWSFHGVMSLTGRRGTSGRGGLRGGLGGSRLRERGLALRHRGDGILRRGRQGAGGWVAAWDCVTNACAYSDLKRASANYGL